MNGLKKIVFGLVFCTGLIINTVAWADESNFITGAEILTPFKKDLKEALMNGLAQSPANAIDVCKLRAPEIVDELSHEGVRLGRTSERLRNPANTSPEWVLPILEEYMSKGSEQAPKSVALDNNHAGYVEPIIVQPLCIACHGESVSPEVSAQISQAYPNDQATGYQVGDLRGVFWVEFPSDSSN